MDNVTHAIFLAFSMFALVLGLSYGIYLMGRMNSVATTLIQSNDATSDYQSVSYDSSDPDIKYTRLVGVDTVISTLYRYNKENFSVEIYSKNGSLHQIFDLTIENVITGESKPENPEWVAYNNLYGENGKECYLFKAPWIVGPEYTKQRIDMYVAGKKAYINGIEVYRPLLIRSGQQEGLSIINPDMVEKVGFSAGGFDAKYGDKMSSVLDIQYKKVKGYEGAFSASMLGASAYWGYGNDKFSMTNALRYKTTAYLLGSLDTEGEYEPSDFDYQTYLSWSPSSRWTVDFIGNISRNNYDFTPSSRTTKFGTAEDLKEFKVYFDGMER